MEVEKNGGVIDKKEDAHTLTQQAFIEQNNVRTAGLRPPDTTQMTGLYGILFFFSARENRVIETRKWSLREFSSLTITPMHG